VRFVDYNVVDCNDEANWMTD